VLPLLFEMSLKQPAQVTGLSVSWVSKQRNRFINAKFVGDASVPARGARRRQNITYAREVALLEPLLERAKAGGVVVIGQIKPQIEEALGRPTALSSLNALLHRHNWRKFALRQTPSSKRSSGAAGVDKNSPKHFGKMARDGKARKFR